MYVGGGGVPVPKGCVTIATAHVNEHGVSHHELRERSCISTSKWLAFPNLFQINCLHGFTAEMGACMPLVARMEVSTPTIRIFNSHRCISTPSPKHKQHNCPMGVAMPIPQIPRAM